LAGFSKIARISAVNNSMTVNQLDWLISTTAMIVLFWFRATRDLLKSFGWGIAALHRLM
jgi:hypothetical protein